MREGRTEVGSVTDNKERNVVERGYLSQQLSAQTCSPCGHITIKRRYFACSKLLLATFAKKLLFLGSHHGSVASADSVGSTI